MTHKKQAINWLQPKLYKGISMHEQEMRTLRYKFSQFCRKLWRKIQDTLHPKKSSEEWYKQVKKADELNAKERRVWEEEQAQMWRDYYDGLC